MSTTRDQITDRLDTLENELPSIPSKTLGLTRATVRRTNAVACGVAERLGDFARPVASTATTATKTVVGQARSAVDRSVDAIRRGRNETVGQLGAQVDRTVRTLGDETEELLDDATRSVAPERLDPASLENLTKEELYERAQDLDIEGRSQMSKSQLIAALRAV